MPFELRAKIGLDSSGLIAGLEQGKAAVRSFGSSMKSHLGNELNSLKGQFAAAFGVGLFVGGVRGAVEFADAVDDVATKLEVSAIEAQRLMYVAERTGSGVKQVLAAMGKEAKEYLLTATQVKEIMDQFDASGLALKDEEIAKLAKLRDMLDDIAGYWKKTMGGLAVDFQEAFGGTISNLGLLVQGLAESFLDRVNNKGNAQFEYGSELIAQSKLGGDEEYDASLEETKRLQKTLNEKLRKKNEGRTGYDSPIGPPEATDKLHNFTPIEAAKKSLDNSLGRQFDSLARIGGNMGNENREMPQLARQVLKTLLSMEAMMKAGGLGASDEGMESLL